MQLTSDLAAGRIVLAFDDEAALRAFVEASKAHGACLLELPEPPAPHAEVTIRLELPPSFRAQFEATVVQLFEEAGRHSAAFEITSLTRSWELDFERRLRRAQRSSDDATEMTGVAPVVRIRQMNVRERMFLAAKANRVERSVLQRDASAQVLLSLVTNPRITADDIVQVIKNPQASPGVLDRITKETRWLANSEIQKALVRNPKTPAPIAMRLVGSLPTEELRRLAKMRSGVREPLRKAALREVLKRQR